MSTRIKRDRVIISKTSQETLAKLNEAASKANLVVVIGCFPAGTEFPEEDAILVEPKSFYAVVHGNTKLSYALVPGSVCFTTEDVLQRIIDISSKRGDTDGDD